MNETTHSTIIAEVVGNPETIHRFTAQKALSVSAALQDAILNSANVSMIATNEHGNIQFFNAGAVRLFGYAAAEVINKISPGDLYDLDELMARADALSVEFGIAVEPGFAAIKFKADRSLEDVHEATCIRKDGSRFPACVAVTLLRGEQGETLGYLLIASNSSARMRAGAELSRGKANAEKASLAKSDFLVQLSHELRTPLNVILGFAQLMESGVPPPPQSQIQNLKQILLAGRYLLDLSNEILDLALLESGKVTLSVEPVSLDEVMLECRSLAEVQAKKRGVRMTYAALDNPIFVKADRTRLKQVLMNFLSNAIKYNKPGGAVTVDCTGGFDAGNAIRINVRDSGRGMSPEQLAELFQPFNRLGQEAGEEPGIGIGLVVSNQLAELMGGTIGADSAVGEGSVFWLELTATAAPRLLFPQAARALPVPPPLPEGMPPRPLLYVEDNPANLKLVEQIIARRPDLRLLTATDAMLGIAAARAHLPAVILMDINMPGISGIEAMKILRQDPSTAHIPIIALSANAMPHDIQKGLESGFFNYVTKPIRVRQFMEAVDAAMHYAQFTADGATSAAN